MARSTQQYRRSVKRGPTFRYHLESEDSDAPSRSPSPPPPRVSKASGNRRKQSQPKPKTVVFARAKFQIPKKAFERLVRDILRKCCDKEPRITAMALEALQTVCEERVINTFEQWSMLSSHAGRVTVKPADAATLRRLQFQ
uniref:Histone domain-containing protein n=1 Tax=Panagrellus redivivus TaxID=6233 RepID=A0A7E4V0U6_PANRE